MTRLLPRVAIVTVLMLAGSGALHPCGGPESYPIDAPLAPPHSYLEGLVEQDLYTGERRPEVRFLYPFLVARPEAFGALWELAYGPDVGPPGLPDSSLVVKDSGGLGLATALDRGDLAGAEHEARAIVERVLDMPATQADRYQLAFRRAIELLELRDSLAKAPAGDLAGTLARLRSPLESLPRSEMAAFAAAHPNHPRAPSLRYVGIQEAMKSGIADGWPEDVAKNTPPDEWARLAGLVDRWLADYPRHPLADLVRLTRVRLFHLQRRDQDAWRVALGLYPRRPARALGEMRFLLLTGYLSGLDSLVFDPSVDPPLRVALLGEIPAGAVSAAEWGRLWKFAADHREEPWAETLEERLLRKVAEWPDTTPLPPGFPGATSGPPDRLRGQTEWGYFRALALLRAGDAAGALAQTEAPGMPADAAPLRVQLQLRRGAWSQALNDPKLDPYARQYLVWVLAPDSVLASMAKADGPAAPEARLARAVRARRRDGWAEGVRLIQGADSAMVTRWRRAARLAADTSLDGLLAYARFLAATPNLYFALTPRHAWFRSVEYRRTALLASERRGPWVLPWRADGERAAIERHYLDTSAEYEALGAYAAYLDRAPPRTPGYAAVVREADRLYNGMINWDHTDPGFWAKLLPGSPEAQAIRRAGRKAGGA